MTTSGTICASLMTAGEDVDQNVCMCIHGRRLGDPPKFEVGKRPIHPSPNILRSTVMGCEAKYKMTKIRCQGGIFLSEIDVFGQEKRVILCFISDFRQNRV